MTKFTEAGERYVGEKFVEIMKGGDVDPITVREAIEGHTFPCPQCNELIGVEIPCEVNEKTTKVTLKHTGCGWEEEFDSSEFDEPLH